MKFRHGSDEEMCGASCEHAYGYACACTRRKGHVGDHIAVLRDAADADGVCYACRAPTHEPHREDCYLNRSEDS